MIDFKELPVDGIKFEQLIRELIIREGLEAHWTGVGADGRKDLVVTEKLKGNFSTYNRKWLVSCKHFAHRARGGAVTLDDLGNFVADCAVHGAEGFILACSTHPASSVVTRIEDAAKNNSLFTKLWDAIEIERRLVTPNAFSLIHTFFPVSAKSYKWNIYNTNSPSFWAAHYKDYFIYLSSRHSTTFPYLDGVETLIDILERIKTYKDEDSWWESHYLRPRAIYYDDKHCTHRVFVDYIIASADKDKRDRIIMPQKLKQLLQSAFTKADHDVVNPPDWDLRYLTASTGSDSFQFDHKDYYEPYLEDFERGSERDDTLTGFLKDGFYGALDHV